MTILFERPTSYLGCLLLLILLGCDANSYTPSSDELLNPKHPARPFIIEHGSLTGEYGNMDVDAAVFRYMTNIDDSSEFWRIVEQRSLDHGWTHSEIDNDKFEMRRYKKPASGGGVHEIRVARRNDGEVVVAWVQSNTASPESDVVSTGPEDQFANKTVWPKFQEVLGR